MIKYACFIILCSSTAFATDYGYPYCPVPSNQKAAVNNVKIINQFKGITARQQDNIGLAEQFEQQATLAEYSNLLKLNNPTNKVPLRRFEFSNNMGEYVPKSKTQSADTVQYRQSLKYYYGTVNIPTVISPSARGN